MQRERERDRRNKFSQLETFLFTSLSNFFWNSLVRAISHISKKKSNFLSRSLSPRLKMQLSASRVRFLVKCLVPLAVAALPVALVVLTWRTR